MPFKVRHLSASDLQALSPSAEEASGVIGQFYSLKSAGRIHLQPKLTMVLGPGHLFQSLCCASDDPALAICKWIGVSRQNGALGLPNVNGIAILSDADTGVPLAMIDAAELTAIRTAATSLYAAGHLARKKPQTMAFVGSGVQALSHLALFSQAFPSLSEIQVLGGHRGCEAVKREAETLGLKASILDRARDALDGADLVITSIPDRGGESFLEADWLPPGCFVSAVDLGRSWRKDGLSTFDLTATDDHDNSAEQQAQGIMPAIGRAAVDLSDLASGAHKGRTHEDQRIAFIFPGFALSDLALASLYLATARQKDIGTEVTF